jgi:hypothetical protein
MTGNEADILTPLDILMVTVHPVTIIQMHHTQFVHGFKELCLHTLHLLVDWKHFVLFGSWPNLAGNKKLSLQHKTKILLFPPVFLEILSRWKTL